MAQTTDEMKIHPKTKIKTITLKKKRQATINLVFVFSFLITMVSCLQETIYHSYQPVSSTGWDKNDTLYFPLPTSIHAESHEYIIGIRHLYSYKYKDIWLKVNQDTIHLYLADSTNNWKGNGIGEIRQFNQPFKLHLSFNDSIREFHVTHIMQDSLLNGIQDIGIQIRKKNINE